MKNVKFSGIPQQNDEFRGKAAGQYRGKPKIQRLDAKFRGPRKTVGPTQKRSRLQHGHCVGVSRRSVIGLHVPILSPTTGLRICMTGLRMGIRMPQVAYIPDERISILSYSQTIAKLAV